jgi:hypothetical protein
MGKRIHNHPTSCTGYCLGKTDVYVGGWKRIFFKTNLIISVCGDPPGWTGTARGGVSYNDPEGINFSIAMGDP